MYSLRSTHPDPDLDRYLSWSCSCHIESRTLFYSSIVLLLLGIAIIIRKGKYDAIFFNASYFCDGLAFWTILLKMRGARTREDQERHIVLSNRVLLP